MLAQTQGKPAHENQKGVEQIFAYMSELLESSRAEVEAAITKHFVELVELDTDAFAKFVVDCFWEERFRLGETAMKQSEIQEFNYLSGYISIIVILRIMSY